MNFLHTPLSRQLQFSRGGGPVRKLEHLFIFVLLEISVSKEKHWVILCVQIAHFWIAGSGGTSKDPRSRAFLIGLVMRNWIREQCPYGCHIGRKRGTFLSILKMDFLVSKLYVTTQS